MKIKTLAGLTMLAVFAFLLFRSFGAQVGGYMDFAEAERTGSNAHVVGTWVAEVPTRYDRDTNVFQFVMQDEKGQQRTVRYHNPKPANFEDAEQVVIEGYAQGDAFVAEHILVKCPSKYNDTRALQEGTVQGASAAGTTAEAY